MEKREILHMLAGWPWEDLREAASRALHAAKGAHVFARGLVEFSSHCVRNCLYCGLRRQNRSASRYLMPTGEIVAAALNARAHGADTIVLQSGEGAASANQIAEIVREVADATNLPVTLSVGECAAADYELWRKSGAKRYLLRHETADPGLYARLHPGYTLENRIKCLKVIKELGYETGGGFMVGLPGQTLETLAEDILLTCGLGVDMCGIGPFIAQRDTPLAAFPHGNPHLALRVIAILRILMPNANLPATTALATLDPVMGQTNGLEAGANVLMPSFTPAACASAYNIYDNKNRVAVRDAISAIEAAGRTHNLAELPA